jgi:hypothetical protein
MFLSKLPPKIITYYYRDYDCYVAFYQNSNGDQVGDCQYGATKQKAIYNLQREVKL